MMKTIQWSRYFCSGIVETNAEAQIRPASVFAKVFDLYCKIKKTCVNLELSFLAAC